MHVSSQDTAFVTGGAQGIGLAIARAFAKLGARVALADVDAEKLATAAEELSALTQVTSHVLDVRDRQAFTEVADKVEAELGPVTLLVNNAGVATGRHVTQMDYASWDWVIGVNLNGVINGVQTFVPRMLARGLGGYVVNTSSGAGVVEAGTGFLYTTSKFAVVGLSESLHRELEPFGIGVSVLCPGRVATDIVRNTWALDHADSASMDPAVRAGLEDSSKRLQAGTLPDRVAELVVAAMERGCLHVFTDHELRPLLVDRSQRLLAAMDVVSNQA